MHHFLLCVNHATYFMYFAVQSRCGQKSMYAHYLHKYAVCLESTQKRTVVAMLHTVIAIFTETALCSRLHVYMCTCTCVGVTSLIIIV